MPHQLAATYAARTPVVLAIDDQRAPSPPRCAPTATLRRTDVAPCASALSDAHRRRPLYDASVHRHPNAAPAGPTRATTRAPTRERTQHRAARQRATQPRPWPLYTGDLAAPAHRRDENDAWPRSRSASRCTCRPTFGVRAAEPPARATPPLPAPLSLPPRELEPARAGRERATELPAWT